MLVQRLLPLLACFSLLPAATAQILKLAEMNTEQVRALDREHTVVLLTNGIMEEHGPYLPSFTDGYVDEALAQDLARRIVARPGWTVVLFPTLPLGTNPANIIGGKFSFPASVTVREDTIRAVYMDLGDALGELGFRRIFIVDSHGGPTQSVALDAASDYFRDTYQGTMTHLLGTMRIFDCCHPLEESLPKDQVSANGVETHGGALEQSLLLFLRPDLVPPAFRSAAAVPAVDFPTMMSSAARLDWPGYLGAPRYATAAVGALAYRELVEATAALTNEILDGKTDPYRLARYGATFLALTADVEQPLRAREARAGERQRLWLAAHSNGATAKP